MRIDVFTIFPEVVRRATAACPSWAGRRRPARSTCGVHDLREGATTSHRSVDDSPFGGGRAWSSSPDPVFRSRGVGARPAGPLFLLAPGGRPFDQAVAVTGSTRRAASRCCAAATRGWTSGWPITWSDGELSVGDFVLAGGELAALVVVEAVARLCPTSWGTRSPPGTRASPPGCSNTPSTPGRRSSGVGRPEVLRSGDHGAVAAWRRRQALLRTAERRPDLLARLVRASALRPATCRPGCARLRCSAGTEPV